MGNATSDQHYIKNGNIHNGGYTNFPYQMDITWHYDLATASVIVTNVSITITRNDPVNRVENPNSAFWDTVVFMNPNAPLPTFQTHGSYDDPVSSDSSLSANTIWDSLDHNSVFAYICQNDSTEEYSIKYGGITTYTASKNTDGSWTLLKMANRYNTVDGLPDDAGFNGSSSNYSPWSDPKVWHHGATATSKWRYGEAFGTPSLPTAPIRKTTQVNYHYDTEPVNLIALKILISRHFECYLHYL